VHAPFATITPSGDSPREAQAAESARLASYSLLEESMLEWKPRLAVLIVGAATLAASVGWLVYPGNFGWGAW